MMIRKSLAVCSVAVISTIGCGEPPQIVPAGPPGMEFVDIPPAQKSEDAPAALGESVSSAKKIAEAQPPAKFVEKPGIDPKDTQNSGLKIEIISEGQGEGVKVGQRVAVHYTGKLSTGSQFDSSVGRGRPFEFRVGEGGVIKGWDVGIQGMKVGEKRKLAIPPDMGYGKNGSGSRIPPNSTLVFDVELVKID